MKIKKLTKILYISSNNIDNGKTLLLYCLMIFSVLLLAFYFQSFLLLKNNVLFVLPT